MALITFTPKRRLDLGHALGRLAAVKLQQVGADPLTTPSISTSSGSTSTATEAMRPGRGGDHQGRFRLTLRGLFSKNTTPI